jgi:hypothetical protein
MTLSHASRAIGCIAAALALAAAATTPSLQARAEAARAARPPAEDANAAAGMSEAGPGQEVLVAMQQMHLTVCAQRVQQAMTFLFDGQPAKFVAQPLGPDSDRWPTVFVIESADPAGGHTRLSTLTLAPDCAGQYEQVIYWSEPCSTIKASVFGKFTGEHPLLRDVHVSDDGPALQVYLTPAGAGCVSVKKELFR